MADLLPLNFPIPSEALSFSVDYFDYAVGAGYKSYYPLGLKDSVGLKNVLTSDSSIVAHSSNFAILPAGGNISTDFDLTFNNPMEIASADAIISYTVQLAGGGADAATTTISLIHLRGVTETTLGSVIDTGLAGAGAGYYSRTNKMALTGKHFVIGDILRLRIAIVTTAGVGIQKLYKDPSGHVSQTDAAAGGTITSRAILSLPFKLNL